MSTGRDARRYLPPIFDLARLFPGLKGTDGSENSEGIRKRAGFSFGSRILITGEAGTGKTTFVLAMVRALMSQWSTDLTRRTVAHATYDQSRHFAPTKGGGEAYGATNHELCFLSPEIDGDRLKHLFAQYGWFTDHDPLFNPTTKSGIAQGRTCFIPKISEARIRLPPHGSGDLVDLVIKEVKDRYSRLPPGHDVFVVVDSITAILKDSRDAGERRRDLLLFLDRLEDALRPSYPALIFLIAERPEQPDPVTFADEVAADFVFHLGISRTSPGRWLRTLSVAKSAGVHMTIGDHTWAVLTNRGLGSVIAQKKVAEWIENMNKPWADTQSKDWATVGVFPKPQLKPIGDFTTTTTTTTATTSSDESESSGIRGLDELLSGNVDYWITGETCKGALIPGTTTLLVGTAGSGKTTMCLEFLAEAKAPTKALYVNFEARPRDIQRLHRHGQTEPTRIATLFDTWNSLYRRRGNLDVNLLLAELRFVIETERVDRVALDGLSDLLATTQRDDYARLVEAVLGTIRDANERALTFVTFEHDPARLDLQFPTAEGLSATADNVVVLRRILINDEFRRTAYVLKARGMSPDAQVREVHITDDAENPLIIASGLESHSDLLSPLPKPVEIYLQLFSENAAEQEVNNLLLRRLRRLFSHRVHTFGFSRHAIARTLDDLVAPSGRIPHADVKVVSLDEWWVREYGVPAQRGRKTQHPLLELDSLFRRTARDEPALSKAPIPYGASPAQFWVFEIEKASGVDPKPAEEDGQGSATLRAVPNYTDFGMFCVNHQLWRDLQGGARDPATPAEPKDVWPLLLEKIPRAWVRRDLSQPFGFEDPREPEPNEPAVLVDWLFKACRDKTAVDGFGFDMETTDTTVCFFFELCWAFGASEDFLIRDVVGPKPANGGSLADHPAVHAMRLLQYLVFHGLMTPVPSLRPGSPLFCRHWYSTITEYYDEENRATRPADKRDLLQKEATAQAPFPLPFFPIGFDEGVSADGALAPAVQEAYRDIVCRLERLVKRVIAALLYRGSRADALTDVHAELQRQPPEASNKEDLLRRLERFGEHAETLRDVALQTDVLARGQVAPEQRLSALQVDAEERELVRMFLPAARTLNMRDILELLRWHALRIRILESELHGASLDEAVLKSSPIAPTKASPGCATALTGYCCSGSWMLGVGRRTHSPLLSWKLMEEMTSFDAAVKRSELGAGVPVRKDFYDVFGDRQVLHAPHLTWNKLLLFGGARARRRDRTLCPGVRAAPVFDTIAQQVLNCLTLAKSWRDMSPDDQNNNRGRMDQSAISAVERIVACVVAAMQQMPRRCASCTNTDCASFIAPGTARPEGGAR